MVFDIGDIPSGSLRGEVISHAALASDGASAAYGIGTDAQRFRVRQAAVIVGCDWEPTGANQVATKTASYRRLTIYNASTDGSGTVVLGSLNLSASLASNAVRALTMNAFASITVPANTLCAISQVSVGGNESNGTVVVAGIFHIHYRPI